MEGRTEVGTDREAEIDTPMSFVLNWYVHVHKRRDGRSAQAPCGHISRELARVHVVHDDAVELSILINQPMYRPRDTRKKEDTMHADMVVHDE